MTRRGAVLHLTEELIPSGCSRVMCNLARLADRSGARPAVAGLRGDAAFVESLRGQGFTSALLAGDLSNLEDLVPAGESWAMMVHRPGNRARLWDDLLPALKARGAEVIIERNIFGYVDELRGGGCIDLTCCNSMNTLWRHWNAAGRPEIEGYLKRHRVLYNPVLFDPAPEVLAAARADMRGALGIPADAFVIASISRPDPLRLDFMMPAILRRLEREIGGYYFLARSYPGSLARDAAAVLGPRFKNLPVTSEPSEMQATYAACDVVAHFSSMGESFGMAIAEAMRCGLPVVTTETPGPHSNAQVELVEDGETGYVVGDPLGAVRRLAELGRSAQARQRMGSAGREKFRRPPFAPSCVIDQLEGEFSRLAASQSSDEAEGPRAQKREPDDRQLSRYLSGYDCRPKAAQAHASWGDRLWRAGANARRLLWRVRRRLRRGAD